MCMVSRELKMLVLIGVIGVINVETKWKLCRI